MMADACMSGIKKQKSDPSFGEPEGENTHRTQGYTDDTEGATGHVGRHEWKIPKVDITKDIFSGEQQENTESLVRIMQRLTDVVDVDKPDLYFSLWDSGGQILYYNTHQASQ